MRVCMMSENCKSLVLQDKCNFEMFLSAASSAENLMTHRIYILPALYYNLTIFKAISLRISCQNLLHIILNNRPLFFIFSKDPEH